MPHDAADEIGSGLWGSRVKSAWAKVGGIFVAREAGQKLFDKHPLELVPASLWVGEVRTRREVDQME